MSLVAVLAAIAAAESLAARGKAIYDKMQAEGRDQTTDEEAAELRGNVASADAEDERFKQPRGA